MRSLTAAVEWPAFDRSKYIPVWSDWFAPNPDDCQNSATSWYFFLDTGAYVSDHSVTITCNE
jgi:hypothetical protein